MTNRAPHSPTFSDIVLESSLDGIVAYDRELRYTTWNEAMERLSGMSRNEVIGRSAFELFPVIQGTPYEELLLAPLEGRSFALYDEPTPNPDDQRYVETHSAPLYDASGDIVGGLCIVRDVTERHSLEEQLRHSHKLEAVGRLAGGIAHDFNNLLTAIRGFTELFGQRTDDEDARRYAGEITKAADQAGALVHHLLSFSRREMLRPEVIDVNGLVAEMEEMLRRLLGESILLEVEVAAKTGTVEVDAGDLEQILLNLVVNARDAMPEGGVLAIATAERSFAQPPPVSGLAAGDYVTLIVADTGTGMDATTAARAFEPFFTTKDAGKGTGLGLSTVYGIASRSGGAIDLETSAGRGTTVTVYLPRAGCDAKPEIAPEAASDRTAGTILLVEDAAGVRTVVSELLRSAGYRVLEAASGEAALERLRASERPIDLLLTDVVLPRMRGPALVVEARAVRSGLKALYMSGYADDVLSEADLEQDPLLHKPFSKAQLLERVSEALETPAGAGDNVVSLRPRRAERTLRVVVADDHPAVLAAVRAAFDADGIEIVAEAAEGASCVDLVAALRPDIAIVDARMPELDGIAAARRIAATAADTAVIVYSGFADPALLGQAVEAGARGFVLKDAPVADLARAVRIVSEGQCYTDPRLAGLGHAELGEAPRLTARERDVLRLAADGMTNNTIADRLAISPETVQTHVRKAMAKLEAESRTQAVAKALRRSLIA